MLEDAPDEEVLLRSYAVHTHSDPLTCTFTQCKVKLVNNEFGNLVFPRFSQVFAIGKFAATRFTPRGSGVRNPQRPIEFNVSKRIRFTA